ncbi:glycerate kinase [Mycobacterium simiae]|uniref:glycerate kinase n=1 Tax=Mycobacterium simiae TaxID=1784 RepID=UPI0026080B67|nr:glycerate kinase [Mycobacterium simiae]
MAADKFKGSLSAAAVGEALARGIRAVCPTADVDVLAVADGGEGTADVAAAAGFTVVVVTVCGPTLSSVDAAYLRSGDTGLIEVAAASGLAKLPGALAPMFATSRGTGELIAHAARAGCRRIYLAAGGSACTDGGAGMLHALGAKILDDRGRAIGSGGGAELLNVSTIDVSAIARLLGGCEVVLASDVDNPLVGPTGAAFVYSHQKGASAAQQRLLDEALTRWADVVYRAIGTDYRLAPGAGAAGGIGFAALAALRANRIAGADMALGLLDFDNVIAGADLVITGEGSLDAQSLHGKAPVGVARRAGNQSIPVVAVCGRNGLTAAQAADAGFIATYALAELEPDLSRSIARAAQLLEATGRRIAREQLDQT